MLHKKIKLFVPGGRLATDDFAHLIELCKLVGVNHFQFGRRQEIIIRLARERVSHFERSIKGFAYEIEGEEGYQQHNVVSSFLTEGISPSTYWMRGGIILDILDHINWIPSIRVNITDLKQDLVFSFYGDVNCIPSDQVNFWHVYLRNRKGGDLFYFPYLIHSDDIHRLVADYEVVHKDTSLSIKEKTRILHQRLHGRLTPTTLAPQNQVSEFHTYEGLHPYGGENYWLGIYKRETKFQFSELEAIVSLCKQHMIGSVNITPWKSLLIKGITNENLTDWKFLLAQNGINVGHSQAELNWQINDFDDDAHELKAYIRKEFAANDIASTGAIIGINNDKQYSFSHIIIEKTPLLKFLGSNEISTYTIYVRKEFNPTYNEFEVFKKWVTRNGLVDVLQKAFKLYHEKAYKEFATFTAKPLLVEKERVMNTKVINDVVHQCASCGTVYFSEIGDLDQEIIPGTSFKELPESYCCSVCESPKKSFLAINRNELLIATS